jgi:phosphoglycerate dehydrogenase-like enzyme
MTSAQPFTVAILDDYQGVALHFADWNQLGPRVHVTVFRDHLQGDALITALAGFDAVVVMRERARLPRALFERLPKLRLVVTTGMRNNSIDVAAAAEHGIVVSGTGWPDASATTEITWALILAVRRNLVSEHQRLTSGGWQSELGTGLAGQRLGVIGLGKQGRSVAAIGRAFGMEVVAWSPNLDPATAAAQGVQAVSRDELFESSDVITLHVQLGDRSRGSIGAPEFAAMKDSAVLINTARGPIVEEGALLHALRSGQIAGAGLDVFDVEPLPSDHPLRTAPGVVLSPHIGYVTRQWYEQCFPEAVEDVAAFLAGTPVRVL